MTDPTVTRSPKATLVIVDDESLIVDSLAFVLEDEGYEVYAASNGRAALDLIRAVHPALVITDFMMPFMSGMELAEALKAESPFDTVPIILASAVQSELARRRNDLFAAVFDKPYRLPALLEKVSELLHAQEPSQAETSVVAFQFTCAFQGRDYRVLVTDDFLQRHRDELSLLGGRAHILGKYRKTFEAIAIGKILRGDEEPVRIVADDLAPRR